MNKPIMPGLSQRFASFMKALFFKEIKGENRLIFNFTGLFIVAITYFFLSIGLFSYLHFSVTRNDSWLARDLEVANSIKGELATFTFGQNHSNEVLIRLANSIDSISNAGKAEQSWKLCKTGLDKLMRVASDPKHDNDPEIYNSLVQSRASIDELVQSLIEKGQHINESLISKALIYQVALILLIVIFVFFGVLAVIKTAKKQVSEIAYFESLAYQFKGGRLDKIAFDCQSRDFTELNHAIIRYIQLLNERYQTVKDQIKNLNFQSHEISLFFKQNDTFYTEIKQELEHLIERVYEQDDKYLRLAEGINLLNCDLIDSQQLISDSHQSLKKWRQVFQDVPESIAKIETRVKKREEYLKRVVGDLYQLRSILEQLLHTGSIFQTVAEQNALLALNASIEAARADTAEGGFDIAAEEIAELAEKIGRVSKELLTVVDTMGVKGNAALKTLETDLAHNNNLKYFIEAAGNKINAFALKLSALLEEAIQYSVQIEKLDEKRKSLEELVVDLGELNQKSQNNYGKTEAALDVIQKSGETITIAEEFDLLIVELKNLLKKIAV
jgi:methyl-accepting chemotaxis protein